MCVLLPRSAATCGSKSRRLKKHARMLNVLQIVQLLNKTEFELADVYAHPGALAKLHPHPEASGRAHSRQNPAAIAGAARLGTAGIPGPRPLPAAEVASDEWVVEERKGTTGKQGHYGPCRLVRNLLGILFRPAQVHFTGACYGGDEGRLEPAAHPLDLWKRGLQDDGHLLPGQVARHEGEFTNRMFFQRPFFQEVVTDLLIASEQDPATLTHLRQPRFIRCSALEMSEVPLEAHLQLSQSFENRTAVAEVFVQVEDKLFTRR